MFDSVLDINNWSLSLLLMALCSESHSILSVSLFWHIIATPVTYQYLERAPQLVIIHWKTFCIILTEGYQHHSQMGWNICIPVKHTAMNVITHPFPYLIHWTLGDLDIILKMHFSILFYGLVFVDLFMIMTSDKYQRTLLMISKHWLR